ncbi:MAG: hypothetical protein HEP71_15190 [Roseivirga sp.]|nr:hypothetical protein [Roseivirga sp.]
MKKKIMSFLLLIIWVSNVNAQDIRQSEIDATCYVLSELLAEAKDKGDVECVIIYANAFDKIKSKYSVNKIYRDYFDSVKVANGDLKGILISLNNPPKSPGFSNKEIDNILQLKEIGISFADFNDFLIIKRLMEGKIKTENLFDFERNKLLKYKKALEGVKGND